MTILRPDIFLDARTGLHVMLRPAGPNRCALGIQDLQGLLLATSPRELLSSAASMPALAGTGLARTSCLRANDALELIAKRELSACVPALLTSEVVSAQALHKSRRRGQVAVGGPCDGDRWVIEPVREWVLVQNLIVLALYAVACPPCGRLEKSGDKTWSTAVCLSPSRRSRESEAGPLDVELDLPMLARAMGTSVPGALMVSRDGMMLVEVEAKSAQEAGERLVAYVDGVLGKSVVERTESNRLLRRPDGAAALLWDRACRPQDMETFVCATCGRVSVSTTRGHASRYCTRACQTALSRRKAAGEQMA